MTTPSRFRLPNFSLPCAIDVLTLGTYPRLPTCIREKIVPPDPITPSEKKQVLQRLNQVIQYRLVSSELPKHMRKLKIGMLLHSQASCINNVWEKVFYNHSVSWQLSWLSMAYEKFLSKGRTRFTSSLKITVFGAAFFPFICGNI